MCHSQCLNHQIRLIVALSGSLSTEQRSIFRDLLERSEDKCNSRANMLFSLFSGVFADSAEEYAGLAARTSS